ncbi:hypothetical protein KA344_10065 [bacterium]|nr:hypothetical protein [bacterium]
MFINRVEYVDHDQFKTIDDEITPWFALYVLCRCYLQYGGKITSYTDTTLIAEVYYLRPEKMILSGDRESMLPLYRAAQAIGLSARPEARTSASEDAISIALTALAQAHSGHTTAFKALLAGANITADDEVAAITALDLEDALAAFMAHKHAATKELSLTEIATLIDIVSGYLRQQQMGWDKHYTSTMDIVNFAFRQNLPVLVFLTQCVEDFSRGITLTDIAKRYCALEPKANTALTANTKGRARPKAWFAKKLHNLKAFLLDISLSHNG